MDRMLNKICGLLESPDRTRRCGAAVVLAELAPKDAEVVKCLGEAVPGADDLFAACLLDALQAIGSKESIPYVMPLLESEDMTLRLRAASVVSAAGANVVPRIRKELAGASRQQKMVLIDLIARVHSASAMRVLLDQLLDPDFEIVKQTCEAVRRHVGDASAAARLKLHKEVVQFMADDSVVDKERVLTSCLLLLGNIGRNEAKSVLMKYVTPARSLYVRRHALVGLRSLEYGKAAATSLLTKLLPYLKEDDFDLARHVLDVIERLPAGSISTAQLKVMLKNAHSVVRMFAVRCLGEDDTAANNRLLVELVRGEDEAVCEVAAGKLAAHPKAAPALIEALATEKDEKVAWRLAKVMKPHGDGGDKKTLSRFAVLAAKELAAGSARYEPLLYFIRNVDAKSADTVLLEGGMKHKQAKRWGAAVECLHRLIHTEVFDDSVGMALSICNLKLSDKDLSPGHRSECHALRGFRSLLHSRGFDLLRELLKVKTLDAADLYYVGFHFREESPAGQEFGLAVLSHVAKRWPQSKEGKAAKSILGPGRAKKTVTSSTQKPTRKKVAKKKTVKKKSTREKAANK